MSNTTFLYYITFEFARKEPLYFSDVLLNYLFALMFMNISFVLKLLNISFASMISLPTFMA